jgi:hypothetical protein
MVGSPFMPPLVPILVPPPMYAAHRPQTVSPSWTPRHGSWDQQSLSNSFNTMTLESSPSLTEWFAHSSASNHTTLYLGSISLFRSPNPNVPSSIIVGNGSILPITSVDDMVLLVRFILIMFLLHRTSLRIFFSFINLPLRIGAQWNLTRLASL